MAKGSRQTANGEGETYGKWSLFYNYLGPLAFCRYPWYVLRGSS
jgi:hypothetical protein